MLEFLALVKRICRTFNDSIYMIVILCFDTSLPLAYVSIIIAMVFKVKGYLEVKDFSLVTGVFSIRSFDVLEYISIFFTCFPIIKGLLELLGCTLCFFIIYVLDAFQSPLFEILWHDTPAFFTYPSKLPLIFQQLFQLSLHGLRHLISFVRALLLHISHFFVIDCLGRAFLIHISCAFFLLGLFKRKFRWGTFG